jgi:hypothetical protein
MAEAPGQAWVGRALVGPHGTHIGTISRLFIDAATGHATWMRVELGPDGKRHALVPTDAMTPEATRVLSPWDADKIAEAPVVTLDEHGWLRDEDQAVLYSHYGRQSKTLGDAPGLVEK